MAPLNKSTGDALSANDIVYIEQDNYTDFYGEYPVDHGFWLNDLYFQVPPERISSQEENNYAEFQSIRSMGSSKIPVGIASEVFTVSFNITSKDSIVNIDTRDGMWSPNTGKRGGILDLILQFKHVPISVIENAYLRSKLKIPTTHNMVFCLHNLSISTSPGEPGVLVGQLTISPMAYTCYSDRWLYKKDWVSKDNLGFEDVNKIDLPGRVPYKEQNFLTLPSSGRTAAQTYNDSKSYYITDNQRTFFVNKAGLGEEASGETYYQSLVNPMFQHADSLNQVDLEFMAPYEATKYAKESAPFKAYIDWIHFVYTSRTCNNESKNNKFDFTQISPYGSDTLDIGDVVVLRWKEFKKIQIDTQVSDQIKLYIKRKIAIFRHDLFKEVADASLILKNATSADSESLAPRKTQPRTPKLSKAEIDARPFDMKAHLITIGAREGGGKWAPAVGANGTLSSATGPFGFLDSTFAGDSRFHPGATMPAGINPKNLRKGKNKDGVEGWIERGWGKSGSIGRCQKVGQWFWADKHDPFISTVAAYILALDQLEEGKANGLPYTYGTCRLSHFLGNGGANILYKDMMKNPNSTWADYGNKWQLARDSNISLFDVGKWKPNSDRKKPENFILERHLTLKEIFDRNQNEFYGTLSDTLSGGWPNNTDVGRFINDNWAKIEAAAKAMPKKGARPSGYAGGATVEVAPDPTDIWGGDSEAKRISDIFNEAIDKLPGDMSDEDKNAFTKYRMQIETLKSEGWHLYDRDLTCFDTFYRTHELYVTANSGITLTKNGSIVSPHPSEPISCEFISGTIFNLFKKIPIQGIIYPTAQYLGKTDNTFLITFKGNGLNTIKKLDMIRDTLKKQGIVYKHIPESYCLEVENKLINAFGDKYFVINAYESSTVPEQPGTYSTEYRLTANDIVMQRQTIKRESLVSDEKIKMTWLDELFENSKNQKNIFLFKSDLQFTLKEKPDRVLNVPINLTRGLYEASVDENAMVWWKGRFKKSAATAGNLGLTIEDQSFMNEFCAHLNLCNKLIMPSNYEYAAPGYKLEYPNKKIIKKFVDAGFLYPTLKTQAPIFYFKDYKPNSLMAQGPATETESYQSFMEKSNSSLQMIASPMWDYLLEKKHTEYDLSDSPLRTFAFTFSEGEDVIDYARAKSVWVKMGDLRFPFPPYISAHRSAMAVASSTWLLDAVRREKQNSQKRSYYPIPQMYPDPYIRGGWQEITGFNLVFNNVQAFIKMAEGGTGDVFLPVTGISNFGSDAAGGVVSEEFLFFPKENWIGGGDLRTVGKGNINNFGIIFAKKSLKLDNYTVEDLVDIDRNNMEIGFCKYSSRPYGGSIVSSLLNPEEANEIGLNYYSDPLDKIARGQLPEGLILPNKAFMEYVFNYLIIPYLNNILRYDDIYRISIGTDYFPKTRALLISEEQSNIGPAYNDLLLPHHPYWNANGANLSRGNTYTEPDFYLVNPGVDALFEDNSQRVESKKEMTPDEAYNAYINLQSEFANADIEMLQESQTALHADFKVGKTDRREEKQINAIKSDLHKGYNAPPTVMRVTNDPKAAGAKPEPKKPTTPGVINTEPGKPAKDQKFDEMGRLIIHPTTDVVEWKDVALIFGDNLDLISSLNSNTDGDGKFNASRLLNWDFQSYDLLKGEEAILAIRNGWDKSATTIADPDKILTDEQKKLPKPEQDKLITDWKKKNLVYKGYNFKENKDSGNGDSSPYINFSNTRYPTQLKLNEAIKHINKKKLAARRAFPVCKVYFFDEDSNKNSHYLSFDECYSYSNIESVQITESRKRPASMCKIAFSDPNGVLSGFNQWNKALHNELGSQKKEEYDASFGGGSIDTESSNVFLQGTKYEQSDFSFVVNAGLKIKVCLGYSNDANRLEEVFLGEITDVMLDNGGNRVEVLAMGYGAELVAKIKGVTGDEADEDYLDTFSLLANLMFSEEILHFGRKKFGNITMFGEGQSLKRNQIQYKETFAIGGMINSSRPGGFPNYAGIADNLDWNWFDGIADAWNNDFADAAKMVVVEPLEGPQDDNIFAPNYLPIQGYHWYDFYKRFTGKVSKDGDYKKISATGEEEPTDAVDIVASYGVGIGVAAGVAAGTYVATGLVGLGFTAAGIVLAGLGVGIVAALLVVIVVGIAVAAYTAVADDEKKEYDSPQLIQIYSKESLIYNLFYTTVWDVFEEMTLRHPGYVKYPRIYGKSNRMTMFFGLPDQNMWETCGDPRDNFKANRLFKEIAEEADARYKKDYNIGENSPEEAESNLRDRRASARATSSALIENKLGLTGDPSTQGRSILVNAAKLNEFLGYVVRRFKPFRRWHNINSYTDIISNDIEATADGWYTEVNIQFVEPQSFNALSIDSVATDAADKVEDAGAEYAKIENPNSLVSWDKNNIVTKKANVDLPANLIRSTTYQFPNCRGIGMAKTYARSMLAKQAKEMYKGNITILGNPSIRPFDVCMVADTYNNIYGPIEVEEVNHIFTPETGYITVIAPDTFVIQEDMTPYVIMNGVMHDVFTRTEYYMNNTLLCYPAYGNFENYSSEGRTYYHELDEIVKKYAAQVEDMNREMDLAKDMFNEITDNAVAVATTGIGVSTAIKAGTAAGTALAEGATVGAAAVAAAPIVVAGLAIAGAAAAMAYFYASSTMTQIIMDYIADSRAFFVVPLVREGVPMIAGTTIGNSSGLYKSPMQYIRQYWMDGGMGRSMQESDLLMNQATVWERNGGKMDSLLARSELWLPRASMKLDAIWNDLGDELVSKTDIANVAKRQDEIKKKREEARKQKAAAEAAAAAAKTKKGAKPQPSPAPGASASPAPAPPPLPETTP